jgi:hypothetical protein
VKQQTTIELQDHRLSIAAILAETRRAYDAAVIDAERRGTDPAADITVRRLKQNLDTAVAQHDAAVGEHNAALRGM